MTTKAELIEEIKSNVEVMGPVTEPVEPDGDMRTYNCTVIYKTDANGCHLKAVQPFYVYKEGTPEERAFFGDKVRKNFVDDSEDRNKFLVAELQATEAKEGTEVKVDPDRLAKLGVETFVYTDANGVKKARASLNGQTITREVG